jgi:uncharacterized SAM-binding protein YcdF (DUF218 family)
MIPGRMHFWLACKFLFTILLLFTFIICSLSFYVFLHFRGTAETPIDCGLVFGAAVHSRANPGPAITRRTLTAVRLYREGNLTSIFLTGGKGSEIQESEAAVMRKVAMLEGVDPDDIVIEGKSRSTWENIENSRPLMKDCESIVAISDRYHLARIRLLARQQKWKGIQTYPADVRAVWPFELKSTIREAFGILYYQLSPFFL